MPDDALPLERDEEESPDAEPVSLTAPLVVEGDPAMRGRLGHVLSTLGCDEARIGWADDAAAAIRLLGQQRHGVALIDVGLPEGIGIGLIEWMLSHHRQVPAIALATVRTEDPTFDALRAGAIAYLLKEQDDLELSIVLRSIEQGGAPIDPTIARRVLAELDAPPEAAAALTARERSILEGVSQGLGPHEIAESLSLPRLRVEQHMRHIYRKLAVQVRTEG